MTKRGNEGVRGFERSHLQLEADMDDPNITIHMFPVAFREERVFEAALAEWDAVIGLARQFARESGYDSNPPIFGNSGHVWLVKMKRHSRQYSLVCGAAEVDTEKDRPTVTWMWIHPNCRPNKVATRRDAALLLWERLEAEYGRLEVEPPMSKAMEGFLLKRNHES